MTMTLPTAAPATTRGWASSVRRFGASGSARGFAEDTDEKPAAEIVFNFIDPASRGPFRRRQRSTYVDDRVGAATSRPTTCCATSTR